MSFTRADAARFLNAIGVTTPEILTPEAYRELLDHEEIKTHFSRLARMLLEDFGYSTEQTTCRMPLHSKPLKESMHQLIEAASEVAREELQLHLIEYLKEYHEDPFYDPDTFKSHFLTEASVEKSVALQEFLTSAEMAHASTQPTSPALDAQGNALKPSLQQQDAEVLHAMWQAIEGIKQASIIGEAATLHPIMAMIKEDALGFTPPKGQLRH
ncbi:MAG: hypothetical protein K2Q12_01520 [Rickettsiales bacterium]|nr:hypothetical protein [Rickettsiales bacterium]